MSETTSADCSQEFSSGTEVLDVLDLGGIFIIHAVVTVVALVWRFGKLAQRGQHNKADVEQEVPEPEHPKMDRQLVLDHIAT